ncbi:MAG TPA: hypothetical protein VG326_00170 [Tepidisphaeraceae bacterium]|jgi:hypothetical protein|nr:hypothetical protein [Tepidisphaeraceae bacterium]
MVVYIGSDARLRTWPFDAAKPGFHVTEVSTQDEAVKSQFSKPHVYYAGAFEGCGCGFQYGREYPEVEDDREGLAAAEACRAGIEAYIEEALRLQPAVEIYACWSGDEAESPSAKRALDHPLFPNGFREREFLVVGHSADG